MITNIIIDDGDLFEGTLKQFWDCFFYVPEEFAVEKIASWCHDEDYNLDIEHDNQQATPKASREQVLGLYDTF